MESRLCGANGCRLRRALITDNSSCRIRRFLLAGKPEGDTRHAGMTIAATAGCRKPLTYPESMLEPPQAATCPSSRFIRVSRRYLRKPRLEVRYRRSRWSVRSTACRLTRASRPGCRPRTRRSTDERFHRSSRTCSLNYGPYNYLETQVSVAVNADIAQRELRSPRSNDAACCCRACCINC